MVIHLVTVISRCTVVQVLQFDASVKIDCSLWKSFFVIIKKKDTGAVSHIHTYEHVKLKKISSISKSALHSKSFAYLLQYKNDDYS